MKLVGRMRFKRGKHAQFDCQMNIKFRDNSIFFINLLVQIKNSIRIIVSCHNFWFLCVKFIVELNRPQIKYHGMIFSDVCTSI